MHFHACRRAWRAGLRIFRCDGEPAQLGSRMHAVLHVPARLGSKTYAFLHVPATLGSRIYGVLQMPVRPGGCMHPCVCRRAWEAGRMDFDVCRCPWEQDVIFLMCRCAWGAGHLYFVCASTLSKIFDFPMLCLPWGVGCLDFHFLNAKAKMEESLPVVQGQQMSYRKLNHVEMLV